MTRKAPAARIAIVAASLALALVPAALAGKGKPGGGGHNTTGGGGSLSLVMVTDENSNGLPNWGDQVTFNVSSTVTYPTVELDCYQGGALVSRGVVGFFASYLWPKVFTLSSPMWTAGAADCTARLYNDGSTSTLATSSFHVDA